MSDEQAMPDSGDEQAAPAPGSGAPGGDGAPTPDAELLARQFQHHRRQLRAVAYRMLGSLEEADDAVQEAWFRLSRSDAGRIENLGGWLTTVVGRVCLDMLRSRGSRAEQPLEFWTPAPSDAPDPERDAELADSVGAALLVVLETLTPAERLAFVLHDLFAVPFDDVARIVGRTPAAARQLASRARRRVQGAPAEDVGRERQRQVVDAFLSAAREGNFEALLEVLDPDVMVRAGDVVRTGAVSVARGASAFRPESGLEVRRALVDGAVGFAVLTSDGRVDRVASFTFVRDRIAAMEVEFDPERIAEAEVVLV